MLCVEMGGRLAVPRGSWLVANSALPSKALAKGCWGDSLAGLVPIQSSRESGILPLARFQGRYHLRQLVVVRPLRYLIQQ